MLVHYLGLVLDLRDEGSEVTVKAYDNGGH